MIQVKEKSFAANRHRRFWDAGPYQDLSMTSSSLLAAVAPAKVQCTCMQPGPGGHLIGDASKTKAGISTVDGMAGPTVPATEQRSRAQVAQ